MLANQGLPLRSAPNLNRNAIKVSGRRGARRLVQLKVAAAGVAEGTVQELRWPWNWGSHIRYFKCGADHLPPVILLHGFGVGAWHWEDNMQGLAAGGWQVYAVDLLGQGSSWPDMSLIAPRAAEAGSNSGTSRAEATSDGAVSVQPLIYSTDTWTRQIHDFVEQVVGRPAYLAGNSLGGYVAVQVAARHPSQVLGLLLLNSTPFWSFKPAASGPQGVWGLLPGLDATVPVSEGLKRVIKSFWWDRLRDRTTVKSMLQLVYAHKASVMQDQELVERIIEATEHPAALDAFASIVLAPKSEQDFDAMLASLAPECGVCLIYGKQDPWVVPLWGQRAFYVLQQHRGQGGGSARPPVYLELDPVGHCPQHEAANATNTAMLACLSYMQQGRPAGQQQQQQAPGPLLDGSLPEGGQLQVEEEGNRVITISRVDGSPRLPTEHIARFLHARFQVPIPAV